MSDTITKINQELERIKSECIRDEIRKCNLTIRESKYHHAFSCYGATKILSSLSNDTFSGNEPVPIEVLQGIRKTSVLILRGYIALVYMRSDTLENALDKVNEDSCLFPYKKFFRQGSKKNSSDTLAQHIRNSLCHGSFEIQRGIDILFEDRDWKLKVNGNEFNTLCNFVFDFYTSAFEADKMSK